MLRGVDYLSSVGGGGYAAAWLLANATRQGLASTGDALKGGRTRLPQLPSSVGVAGRNLSMNALALLLIAAGGIIFKLDRSWAIGLLGAGIALLAVVQLPQFGLHWALRRRIVAGYLGGSDLQLGEIGRGAPLPLIGAAWSSEKPLVLSPVFLGNDRLGDSHAPVSTLGAAIALSGPSPDREPSSQTHFAKLVANLHEDPHRTLREGSVFDSIGLYALIQRRCRFVIACDATADPIRSFDALAVAIRKCRIDLNVEIDISLGPLGAGGGDATRHYQMGAIRYSNGETGALLYIKPTITGDEPTDLVQRRVRDLSFPNDLSVRARFDDAAAENYRRLGQHSIETLVQEVKGSENWTRVPVERAFQDIRGQLRPDLREVEHTASARASLPVELVNAIASGECLLCAGAGLAAQAGLPTWPALFSGLVRAGTERGLVPAALATELTQSISAGNLEEAGDELMHRIPEDARIGFLSSALPPATAPSQAHKLLAALPFLGALNWSLDDVLAGSFGTKALLPTDSSGLMGALQVKNRFVVNVSGSPSQPSSVVLNERQFRVGLADNAYFRQFLTTLFLRYHTFYVGRNIDGVRGSYDALTLSRRPERRQFALIPRGGQLDPVMVRYLDRTYNVQVIEYQPGFNFEGFTACIRELHDAVEGSRTPARRGTGSLVLSRVTLENIGPFETLRLDLTPNWNLLLGDNGKGKTVILRAIAAALCGEQADPAAVARLLRAGAERGAITLTIDQRDYTVSLVRDAAGRTRIESASLSPLQSDGLLAIGFPALRSVPWENPSGPKELTTAGPSADDLSPLLRGVPDNRVANLKQWLVNLDYSERTGVITRFFAALQRLTPGLRIAFEGVNRDTMEIQVRTDAATVPFSAVSQGTGSVMCWIGTLIQRMSEAGVEPDGHALVLVDELDAHMHPKWQQMFIAAFRSEFKGVQVIATSHSPLLVGSLSKEEIWLTRSDAIRSEIYGLARVTTRNDGHEILVTGPEPDEDEDGSPEREQRRYSVKGDVPLRVRDGDIVEAGEALTAVDARVVAERIDIPAEGWRVDQILTLPYFGLDTTRDPVTARAVDDFTKLSVQTMRTVAEQARLDEAATRLQVRTPAPHESEAARKAFELINDFADQRLQQLPLEERQKVLAEVQVQLLESMTGSRRPM